MGADVLEIAQSHEATWEWSQESFAACSKTLHSSIPSVTQLVLDMTHRARNDFLFTTNDTTQRRL